ncbi:MAG: hypothetical protein MUC63_09585 [Planctomycetes bacterium]|jgi:hypothetical protein|nr:hypothetical protein [Planctomycetota bacterium]
MSDVILECPSCGAKLRLAEDFAGSRIRCSQCKGILELETEEGGGEGAATAEPEGGKAEPAKRKPGSATQAPGDKATKRRARTEDEGEDGTREARRPGDRAKKKDGTRSIPKKPGKGRSNKNLVLALGGVAGLILLAAVVAVFALPKDKAEDDGEGGKGEGKGTAAAKAEEAKKAERERKVQAYRDRAGQAESEGDFLALGEEAEALGLADEAKTHFRKALELDPENEKALEKLRYERYELPSSASDLPAELLGGISEHAGKWLPPEEVKKVRDKEREVLAAARAEVEKRTKDPFYARMADILKSIENVQGFKDYLFHCERADPYLLVEHVGKKGFNPYRSAEAKKLATQKVEALKKAYAFVVETFIRPAGLTRDESRPLAVVSFEDRKVFEEFQKAIGQDLPPGAAAYFSPVTKFVVMNNSPGAAYGPEEDTQSILFHEATHQIVDAFCNPNGGMDVRCSLWFNEGLAEYVGSLRLKPRPDGSFEYLIAYELASGRLAEFYAARFPAKFKERAALGLSSPYALTLEEMVQMHNQMQCLDRVLRKWVGAGGRNPGEADPGMRNHILATAGSLIYAQATSFFFFCLKGKPDAYRDKLMQYLKKEFTGRASTRNAQTFKEIFGKDLAGLEKEWLDYVDSKTTATIKDGHMR